MLTFCCPQMSYQDPDTQMANLRILQQLLPQNNNQSNYYPPAQLSYPPTQVNYTPNTPYSEPFPMQTNTPSVNPPLILKIPRSLATTASTFVTQHSTSSKQQQSRPPDEVITLISDDSNDDANLTQLWTNSFVTSIITDWGLVGSMHVCMNLSFNIFFDFWLFYVDFQKKSYNYFDTNFSRIQFKMHDHNYWWYSFSLILSKRFLPIVMISLCFYWLLYCWKYAELDVVSIQGC